METNVLKFRDSDLLDAMTMHLDEDAVVYGANGRYAVGAYQDLTKVSSVLGDKEYNSESNVEGAKASGEKNGWYDEFYDGSSDAAWMKEI